MQRIMQSFLESQMQYIDMLSHRLTHPDERIHTQFIRIQHINERLAGAWLRYYENRLWSLRELNQSIASAKPDISRLDARLNELEQRLCRAVTHHFDTFTTVLQKQQAHLYLLNPESVLERGYSIVYDKDNKVLRKSDQINVNDTIQVTFAKGWSKAKILEKGKLRD